MIWRLDFGEGAFGHWFGEGYFKGGWNGGRSDLDVGSIGGSIGKN